MSLQTAYIAALNGPILVTGASGFIGANLFKRIFAQRKDVFAVVRQDKGWRLAEVPDANTVASDLTDVNLTKHMLDTIRPATVFYCAAYGAYSFEEGAERIYRTNLTALINFVELLQKHSPLALIHAGSSSEYGTNSAAPEEDAARAPDSHYAVAKSAAADYLRFIGKTQSFPCVNLRLYSVYGALEDTSRLIPNLLSHAKDGHLPPLVGLETSRDFVHIDDVCMAFLHAAVRMNPSLYGESFNIGTGVRTRIGDLVALTQRLFSISEEPEFGSMDARPWDRQDWYANPQSAQRQLNWKAETQLQEGLLKTAQWVHGLDSSDMRTLTKKHASPLPRSISAVVACYMDAPAIPHMHERLTRAFQSLDLDYEIIFVNDCSPDDSAAVIERLSTADPHVIGITHSRNFGSQMAFRSGMELSTKDAVVLLDGDLQDPPELIPAFHQKWLEGYDVVYGRRIKRDMPPVREFCYKAFYRVFAAFSYLPIPHDAGDFSLIDRRVVGWLLAFPERDLFLRGVRAYAGFRQTGVDYVRPERMFGVSTNNLLKNIGWAKKGIFSFSDTPLNLLTATGTVLLAFSAVVASVLILLKLFFPDVAPKGATTLLVTILFFGSLNLFGIGMLGEYIGKIMAEVKGRPRVIRATLIRNGQSTRLLPDGKTMLHKP